MIDRLKKYLFQSLASHVFITPARIHICPGQKIIYLYNKKTRVHRKKREKDKKKGHKTPTPDPEVFIPSAASTPEKQTRIIHMCVVGNERCVRNAAGIEKKNKQVIGLVLTW